MDDERSIDYKVYEKISKSTLQIFFCRRYLYEACEWASLLKRLVSVSRHGYHKKWPTTESATNEAMSHTFYTASLVAVDATCVLYVNTSTGVSKSHFWNLHIAKIMHNYETFKPSSCIMWWSECCDKSSWTDVRFADHFGFSTYVWATRILFSSVRTVHGCPLQGA